MILLKPAPGEGRAEVQAVDVRIHKPKALGGAAVPAVHLLRDSKWPSLAKRVSIRPGQTLDILEEAPTSGAYRICLDADREPWPVPLDVALFVLAGSASTSDGNSVATGDMLPKGELLEGAGLVGPPPPLHLRVAPSPPFACHTHGISYPLHMHAIPSALTPAAAACSMRGW